jgi:hypothetical protein
MSEKSFSVVERDFGHWDITQWGERAYRIRGEKRAFKIYPEKLDTNAKVALGENVFRSDLDALQYLISFIVCEAP